MLHDQYRGTEDAGIIGRAGQCDREVGRRQRQGAGVDNLADPGEEVVASGRE